MRGGQRRGWRRRERAGRDVFDERSGWNQHPRRCRGLPESIEVLIWEAIWKQFLFGCVQHLCSSWGRAIWRYETNTPGTDEPKCLCKQGNLQCPSSKTLEANEKVSSPVADTEALVVQAGILKGLDKSLKCGAVSFTHDLVVLKRPAMEDLWACRVWVREIR